MRLHRLEITAFGPYTDTVRVDLDELCGHGLFLLHGVTGSGKSSLLDAICYALYGQVPGRRAHTTLRSDLAPADTEPVVVLEFTVGSRRLEVRRSPAWERPKKRGSGTTAQQASVRVRESVGGTWQVRATRLDEAGLLLSGVIGMNLDQFTKVVLLPQGDFAAFLHAPADQRRDLLQRLFGTERFEAVERHLAERRRELSRSLAAAHADRDELLARVRERILSVQDLVPAPPEDAEPDAAASATLVEGARGPARQRQDAAAVLVDEARRELATVEQEARTLEEWAAALAERDRLDAAAPQVDAQAARLEAAGRAAGAGAALQLLERDEREVAEARRDQESALASILPLLAARTLPGLDSGVTPAESDLAEAAADRRGHLGRLEHLLVLEQSLSTWEREQQTVQGARARSDEDLARQDRRRADLVAARQAAQAERDAVAATAAGLAGAEREVERARAANTAAGEREAVAAELVAAQDDVRAATDTAQQARSAALDLTRRRLEGMAAELAAGLAPGDACPVCGGVEHPAPATPTEQAVSAQDEEAATARAETAQQRVEQARQQVVGLRERVSALTAASGGLDPEQAGREMAAAEAALDSARDAVEILRRADAVLDRVQGELPGVEAARDEIEARLREQGTRLTELDTRIHDARRTIEDALDGEDSVWGRHERLTREAKLLESARDSVGRLQRATVAVQRTRSGALKACRAAGFADVAAARAAALTEPEVARLTEATQAHRDARLAVQTRLTQLRGDVAETGPATARVIDDRVTAARAALQRAVAGQQEAATAVDRLDRAQQALSALAADLATWQRRNAPLQAEYEVVRDVSQCAEGQGSNTLRLRLSAYALESRLDQVARAASLRLARMSGDRYTLVHRQTVRRGAGRGGLGIAVLDAWTGRERDPASLSGGETFLASLSLALGLADVVQAESGGAHIETLFVDEGFGSLDDESLDVVMDILDGLREGGRAVGVVSHVPELRMRIPARLEVVRRPTGSTVRVA